MIIYMSILIKKIRIILSGDNLTWKTQKKDPFTSLYKIKVNLPLWEELDILWIGALPFAGSFPIRKMLRDKFTLVTVGSGIPREAVTAAGSWFTRPAAAARAPQGAVPAPRSIRAC